MVVVITVGMDVPVVDFFFRRFADADDFDIEVEGLPRHLVIAIDRHLVAFH